MGTQHSRRAPSCSLSPCPAQASAHLPPAEGLLSESTTTSQSLGPETCGSGEEGEVSASLEVERGMQRDVGKFESNHNNSSDHLLN